MKLTKSVSGQYFVKFHDLHEIYGQRELDVFNEAARRGLMVGLLCGMGIMCAVWFLIFVIERLVNHGG